MTAAQFAAYVRLKTHTNSTTFTDTDIIILMRQRQDEIAQAIMKTDEDILLIPQKTDLVADRRDYPYPADILSRIKRVEAKLDGTNWLKLHELDVTSVRTPVSSETDITNNFSNTQDNAFYDLLRKSIVIYSGTITSVTDGLKLWCDTWPTAVTNLAATDELSLDPSTTTHGIPRSMHEIWARGVIIDYKQGKEKPIALDEHELNYEKDMEKAILTLKHGNLDREVTGDLPPPSERGNEGEDY